MYEIEMNRKTRVKRLIELSFFSRSLRKWPTQNCQDKLPYFPKEKKKRIHLSKKKKNTRERLNEEERKKGSGTIELPSHEMNKRHIR